MKISAAGLVRATFNSHAGTAADSFSLREKDRMRGKSARNSLAAPCLLDRLLINSSLAPNNDKTILPTMKAFQGKLDFRGFIIFALLAGVFIVGCDRKRVSAGTSVQVHVPPIKMPDGSLFMVTNFACGKKYNFALPGIHANSTLDLWFYQTARPDNEMQEDVIITVADESDIVHLPQNYGTYLGWTNRIGDCRRESKSKIPNLPSSLVTASAGIPPLARCFGLPKVHESWKLRVSPTKSDLSISNANRTNQIWPPFAAASYRSHVPRQVGRVSPSAPRLPTHAHKLCQNAADNPCAGHVLRIQIATHQMQ
jgi:hypothetical protein